MTIKNADLPAIPCWCSNSDRQLYGLTKREDYVKHIISGIMSNHNCLPTKPEHYTNIVEDAIKLADMALAELEKSK